MVPKLHTTREFDRVYREGSRARDRTVRVAVRPNGGDTWRLGMAVSRKVGGAVVRNKARRRLREIFRLEVMGLVPPSDLVISIIPGADLSYDSLRASVLNCVRRAVARSAGETGSAGAPGTGGAGDLKSAGVSERGGVGASELDSGDTAEEELPGGGQGSSCSRVVRTVRRIYLGPVYLYRLTLSHLIGNQCRFHPTCSQYFIDAVMCHGIFRGTLMGVWRILRCNPFCRGGEDSVRR